MDAVDDWMLFVVGVPVALGVIALWDWQPVAAVAAVVCLLAAVLAGIIVLLRRREEQSWGNAIAALLALLVAGAVFLIFLDLAASAVLDGLAWPFKQLANGFE